MNMRLCMNCMEIYEKQYEVCPYCGFIHGTGAKKSAHLQPGCLLKDRYVVGMVMGQGGFGITYVGWDSKLKQKVAIKEYYPTAFAQRMPEETAVTAISNATEKSFYSGVNKFLSEARIIASFNDQHGIVHVFDYLQANNTAYIIMEFIEGKTVKDLLKERPDEIMTVEEALDTMIPVLQALGKVHKAGVIHRDISPDNIMISHYGDVKLLDFGAARNVSPDEQQKLSVMLKAGYAPPEQYSSTTEQNAGTDIYALGAVLYKLTTGKMPARSLERVVEDNLIPPKEHNDSIPEWLDKVIVKCMELDPADRFQSVEEFLDAICGNGKKLKQKLASNNITRADSFKNRRTPVFIALFAVVIACIVGIAVFTGTMEQESAETDEVTAGSEKLIQIKEYGYHYDDATGDIYAAIILNNTAEKMISRNTTLKLTAKDETGNTIATSSTELGSDVYLKTEIGAACTFYEVCDVEPASVEISIGVEQWIEEEWLRENVKKNGYIQPQINIISEDGNYYECEIINENDYSLYTPEIQVLYRDDKGNLIGGEKTWNINEGVEVTRNATTINEIEVFNRLSDHCEMYVTPSTLGG